MLRYLYGSCLSISVMAAVLSGCGTLVAPSGVSEEKAIVIAHRGASGELPEHTLEAYARAIEQGADWIEPDLVMTKDGVFVARHDPWLSDSTNVADISTFADRKRAIASPDGDVISDWWVWDFTLDELQSLKARQVRAGRSKAFDDAFDIPTLAQIIALADEMNELNTRPIGIYAETKWPSAHKARGLDMAAALLPVLRSPSDVSPTVPLIIQSFEPDILIELNQLVDTPLVQLVWPDGWVTGGTPSVSLDELAAYADGVGPYKAMVIDQASGADTGYARTARSMGLDVHPWTFRDDDLPSVFSSPEAEIRAAVNAGANGIFTDFPATGRRAVDAMKAPR